MRIVSLMAIAAATVAAVPAYATPYISGTSSYSALGDTIGSPFDQIVLNSVAGNFTGPGTYLLHTVDFTVGINATTGATYNSSFLDSITIGANTYTFALPYTLTISNADTIVFNPTSTTLGGLVFSVNPLTFSSIGIGTVSGDLTVDVAAVPEPATWGLMILGFGAIGAAMRRRSVQARTTVTFAN